MNVQSHRLSAFTSKGGGKWWEQNFIFSPVMLLTFIIFLPYAGATNHDNIFDQ
jgi:hypothetical protein